MNQRQQHAQTGAAEALQFLDESAAEPSAPQQRTSNAGELMAGQDHADYDEQYSADDGEYGEAYDEDYDDYSSEDDREAFDNGPSDTPPQHSGLNALVWMGGLGLMMVGATLMAVWNLADSVGAIKSLQQVFAGSGLAPIDIVVLGAVLAGLAGLRRHVQRQGEDLAQALQGSRADAALPDDLQSQIAFLVEAASGPSSQGGGQLAQELQRALHLIKRQEEKINNLSKATKMYGKPLIEITNQMSESTHQLSEIGSRLDAVKVIAEQSANRLETTLRSELNKAGSVDTSGITASIQATRDTVKALEALQRDLSQRLTDKSDKLASDVQSALRDSRRGMESLQQGLEQTQTTIVDRIKGIKLPTPPPPAPTTVETPKELTDAITNIEKQLNGLTQTVAKLGTMATAAPAAPAAAAAPPSAPAPSARKAPAAAPAEPAPDPNAGAGKSSSNVMSAIAKLKQLRT